jgi:capsular exopolysaccharide synthesis family protein
MPENQQEQEFDLRVYFHIVMGRKWLVLGFAATLVAMVAIGTSLQNKLYTAKVTVLVGREAPRLINFDPFPQERFRDKDYLKTQTAILTSRSHLEKVIRLLMEEGFYGKPTKEPDDANVTSLAGALQARVVVTTVEDNQVIKISVEGAVPDRVARLANAVAEVYVNSSLDQKTEMAKLAVDWLQGRLEEARNDLSQAESELREFKEKEKITGDDADPVAAMSLVRLNDDYQTAHFQRLGVESRIDALKRARSANKASTPGQSLDQEVKKQMRETLTKEYLDTQMQLKDLSQRYSSEHPDIITLKAKAERLQNGIRDLDEPELPGQDPSAVPTGNLADLQGEYSQLLTRENAYAAALAAHKDESKNLSKTGVSYALLKQKVDLKKQTYNDLQGRLTVARLAGELKTPSVQILDRALVPTSPTQPQPVRNLLVAIPMGLVLGIGLALLLDTLDRRVKSPQDVARVLKLPLLTVVPGIGLGEGVGRDEGKAKLVTIQQPRSHAAECYRNLRTSILFSSGRPVPRTIVVTSAVAGEGKSTTAANLAVVMAQSGRKVLLIDADLRRPALQRYFVRRESRGLIRILKDGAKLEEAVQPSEVENLDLLLCHGIPSNPSELLGSDRMQALINDMKARYDTIIIDSPVIISVPDAVILAARAEAVVMVHCPKATDRDMVRFAREKLDEVNANILGLVMNRVDVKKGGYMYSNYMYYGYGTEVSESPKRQKEKKSKS